MNLIIYDFGGYPFIFELSQELAKRGHRVNHVYTSPLSTMRTSAEADTDNLKIREVCINENYRQSKEAFLKRLNLEIQHARKVIRQLQELNADALLCSNVPTHMQLMLMRWAKQNNIAFIPWVQDFYSLAVRKGLQNKFGFVGECIGKCFEQIDQHIYKQSDAIVPISNAFIDSLKHWNINLEKVSTIPNWAPVDQINTLPKDNHWSQKRQLEDKFCFLYAGTLGLKHNPGILYQLAERMQEYPEVRIVVLAEGPGANALATMQKEKPLPNLIIEGLQPSEDYAHALASADVLTALLEPDASEYSAPSKVLSYLCAGRPILLAIPEANPAAQIVTNYGVGAIASPREPEAYAEAAVKLYQSSPEQRMAQGRAARAYANEHFNISNVADQFEAILIQSAQKRDQLVNSARLAA